jgi:predicted transcriptional regulator
MRKFSRSDLLGKKLNDKKVSGFEAFLNIFFESKYVTLEVEMYYYDYLRGKTFINDLRKIADDEAIQNYSLDTFIVQLYADFIRQIRAGADMKALARHLISRKNEYKQKDIEEQADLVQKDQYTFVMVREEVQRTKRKENRKVYLPIKILSSEVERGEVMLYDMSQLVPEFHMTLEELLAVRYRDVIEEIKAGNSKIIKAVLANARHGN